MHLSKFSLPKVLVLLALTLTRLRAQELPAPTSLAELRGALEKHLAQPKFSAAIWGVKIQALNSGKVIFEHNPQKLFSPASNSKLYTVALAFDRLGQDYRIKTSLYSNAKPNFRGTLHGDLWIVGRGDPTFNSRLHHDDLFAAMDPLINALTNAGIRRISGDLVADDTFFKGPPYGSGWAWDDLENYYGAEMSALTVNDNILKTTVKPGARAGQPCIISLSPSVSYLIISNRTETIAEGKREVSFFRPLGQNVVYVTGQMPIGEKELTEEVTVHQPAGLFIRILKEALARRGIKVSGKLRVVEWNDPAPANRDHLHEIASVQSPPLSEIAAEILKPSQNLYTDLLLAHVAESVRTSETQNMTSEDLGIRELNRFLEQAGVPKGDVLFEEGSGLSRNNLTTPNATVALLNYMSHHKSADVYLNGLPIAGVDGTLRNRMKDTPAAGNVRAKTGTLRWAISLSGHLKTAAGEPVIFSIMLNRYSNMDPNHPARAEIDFIPLMLAGYKGRLE